MVREKNAHYDKSIESKQGSEASVVADAEQTESAGTKIGETIDFASAEAYKLLRTNLLFTLEHTDRCNVLGVTSSVAGEGKSVTASNLAFSFAEMGKRVLLLECDMRRPVMNQYLGLTAKFGLSNVLAGMCTINDALHTHPKLENYKVMASGDIPPNPSELLSSARMEKMLRVLSEKFDVLLMDLPPVTVVADAAIVSQFIQGLVLVVRDGYAEKNALTEAIRQLNVANAKILGVVYNHNSVGSAGYRGKGYYKKNYYKKNYYKKNYYKKGYYKQEQK